jgi:periplasmic protein TonB
MAMFDQTFVDAGKTRTTWSVLVSGAAQVVLIFIAFIIPMIYFDALPKSTLTSFLVAPPPPPPPPPPPEIVKVVKVIPRQFDAGRLMAPREVPKTVAIIKEDEAPPSAGVGVVGGVAGGVASGLLGGILGGTSIAPPPPPPPVQKVVEKPVVPQRIRVGGNVQGAKLIRQPKPVYPPLAKQARIQGVVKLHALISKEGTIEDLKVISGHPLLVPSALEAVKQWVYQPTTLNGDPVGVDTEIDVNFTLSQ